MGLEFLVSYCSWRVKLSSDTNFAVLIPFNHQLWESLDPGEEAKGQHCLM